MIAELVRHAEVDGGGWDAAAYLRSRDMVVVHDRAGWSLAACDGLSASDTRRVKLPASHGEMLCPRHDHENVAAVPRARRHSHAGSRLARPDLFLNSAQQVASIMVPPCCRLLASSEASIRRCPGRLNQPREISFSVFVSLTNLSQGVPTSACDRRPRPMWSRLHTWPRRTRDKELRY